MTTNRESKRRINLPQRAIDNARSRYSQGGTSEEFRRRTGWWERDLTLTENRDSDEIIKITSQYDKRPDLMAVDVYGSALLQWLILQYNNIVDINEEFVAGKFIKLPIAQRVLFDFLNKRTGGIPPRDTTISS